MRNFGQMRANDDGWPTFDGRYVGYPRFKKEWVAYQKTTRLWIKEASRKDNGREE